MSQIINSGQSFNLVLQKQLRELVWWLAKYDAYNDAYKIAHLELWANSKYEFKIKGVHIFRKNHRIPDLLSRWHEGPHIEREFKEKTEDKWKRRRIDSRWFTYTHDW